MRYIIIERNNAYQKFEIDKHDLAKVKIHESDMIIDTEENKVFREETVLFDDNEFNWFDMKSYDKRYDS